MNKLHEVVQKFRSSSIDTDKATNDKSSSKFYVSASSDGEDKKISEDNVWTTNTTPPLPDLPPLLSDSSKGKQGTILSAEDFHNSVLSALGGEAKPDSALERKLSKKKPKGTLEYTVVDRDTLQKIGASFDTTPSELMKLNRMGSRTVFTGQTLFIPDPDYVASPLPSPRALSPVLDGRTKVDIPIVQQADQPPSVVPGHLVRVVAPKVKVKPKVQGRMVRQESEEEEEDHDRKFVKIPARRVLEDAFDGDDMEGMICRGTLLVTPNAIMFDPDVEDSLMREGDQGNKFPMVVYMDQIKGVALFYSMAKMFWRQTKEERARSPKPEIYHGTNTTSTDEQRPSADGTEVTGHMGARSSPSGSAEGSRPPPEGASGVCTERASPEGGGGEEGKGGRTSQELEDMTQAEPSPSPILPGRASKEVEHTLTGSEGRGHLPSPLTSQMSRSSELAGSEISLLGSSGEVFGETRDFGGHLGRSSSEIHSHLGLRSISASSPGGLNPSSPSSTSDTLPAPATPTQGFAPVFFTDRSPNSTTETIHIKPVPVQRSKPPTESSSNQSELKLITEESSSSSPRNSGDLTDSDAASAFLHSEDKLLSVGVGSGEGKDTVTSQPHTADLKGHVKDASGSATSAHEPSVSVPSISAGSRLGSSFSPLKAPVQHISSLFNYTTSLFRSGVAQATQGSQESDVSKELEQLHLAPQEEMRFPLIQSGFSREELTKALGPDPKSFLLQRSDSPHFLEPPLYLQIRPGIHKEGGTEPQCRAFDHRNYQSKMLEEYWFVVPRSMGDKLYQFLLDWQPSAYGDQDQLHHREQHFYDSKDVTHLIQPLGRSMGESTALGTPLKVADNHFTVDLKTWEVLSAEEVGLCSSPAPTTRDDTIDESNMPDLIHGTSCILGADHVNQLIRAIPRSMSAGYDWSLVFSTKVHGYSLRNLYRQMVPVDDQPVLLFIKDTDDHVFGAYLSNKIKTSETFYGTGSTFLFSFYPEFKKFTWQGDNSFFINGTTDFFAIGAGQGLFGLWVDDNLNHGRTHACGTFQNDVLTSQEDFRIIDVEAWTFVDCSLQS